MVIEKTLFGVLIKVFYFSITREIEKFVEIIVDCEGKTYNVSATASLDAEGQLALDDAISMAKVILRRGWN